MELLVVYFENLIYNLSIKFKEFLKWGMNKTWLKIQFLLFREYFLNSPFSIIKKYANKNDDFIYGETPLLTLDRILNDAGVTSDDVFVDLGCGRGLTLFGAYLSKNMKCVGIDLIEPFIKKGKKIALELKTDKIEFITNDITTYDFSTGNVFFIAGTTFDEELINKVAKKLSKVKANTKIISLSQKINAENFKVMWKKKYQFSWGDTLVYMQEKQE